MIIHVYYLFIWQCNKRTSYLDHASCPHYHRQLVISNSASHSPLRRTWCGTLFFWERNYEGREENINGPSIQKHTQKWILLRSPPSWFNFLWYNFSYWKKKINNLPNIFNIPFLLSLAFQYFRLSSQSLEAQAWPVEHTLTDSPTRVYSPWIDVYTDAILRPFGIPVYPFYPRPLQSWPGIFPTDPGT